jgi:L-arabinose isomerase
MEDYTYHFGPESAKVLGAHMLELCPSIAVSRPRCEVHPVAVAQRDDPVRLVFTAAPGPAVVAAWMDLGTRFRMVVNEVDVVPPVEDLPRLPVPRAVWEPRQVLATAAQAWMSAGGSHHTVFSTAANTEKLDDFASMIGLELVVIDNNATRMREFGNELRWNQVYYYLVFSI